MKKAMLFFAAFIFSVSAHAATLNLAASGVSNATQTVDINNNSTVIGSGTVNASGSWSSLFNLTTDVDTPVRVEWSFNPENAFDSATLLFGAVGGDVEFFDITSDFIFTAFAVAGETYFVDIFDASSDILKYDVSISAVPVPAALFLFAPALLGLIGLRRKAAINAAA